MRGKRIPSDGRLLFFLEEKKQKKINCGAAFLLCSCRFRQRAAQNGRFKCEPSVFLFRAGHAGKHLFTDKSTAPQCLLFLFFKKRNRSPSFLFRRKNGQLAREAQPLRRTDAGTSCVVVGRNTTAGMPPSSALSLPVSAAPARRLSRANRPRKRKSSAEQGFSTLLPFSPTCCTKRTVQIRTVRFFCSGQDTQESIYSQINQLPRNVFCFFSSRKEIVPLLFFLEEKKSSPLEEKKSFPPLVSPSHGAGVTAGAGLIVGSSCARYASTISSTDSSFRMMEISMRRLRVRPASVAFVSTGRVAP